MKIWAEWRPQTRKTRGRLVRWKYGHLTSYNKRYISNTDKQATDISKLASVSKYTDVIVFEFIITNPPKHSEYAPNWKTFVHQFIGSGDENLL